MESISFNTIFNSGLLRSQRNMLDYWKAVGYPPFDRMVVYFNPNYWDDNTPMFPYHLFKAGSSYTPPQHWIEASTRHVGESAWTQLLHSHRAEALLGWSSK